MVINPPKTSEHLIRLWGRSVLWVRHDRVNVFDIAGRPPVPLVRIGIRRLVVTVRGFRSVAAETILPASARIGGKPII